MKRLLACLGTIMPFIAFVSFIACDSNSTNRYVGTVTDFSCIKLDGVGGRIECRAILDTGLHVTINGVVMKGDRVCDYGDSNVDFLCSGGK